MSVLTVLPQLPLVWCVCCQSGHGQVRLLVLTVQVMPLNNKKEALPDHQTQMLKFPILQFPIFSSTSSSPPAFAPVPPLFKVSTWDEPQSLRNEHTANNLWCLSQEVRSFLHTLGTFFLPISLLRCCQKNILICNLWLEEWQTDRHMCTVHICFPALDLWSTVELQRESERKAALQQMVLLKEPRWNSLCYKCSLVFFETPIGSGSPAGLRSNVLRPNECISMHTHTHTCLSDEWSHLSSLRFFEQTAFQSRLINCRWNQAVIIDLVIWHFRWLNWDFKFSLIIQYNTD